MKPVRTGALVAAGAVVGRTVARKITRRQGEPAEKSRWLAVTVNASPEKVEARLVEAVADLEVETRLTAAPAVARSTPAARAAPCSSWACSAVWWTSFRSAQ